jgi:23S rRNA (adenine2503-C2)-methyltransferase
MKKFLLGLSRAELAEFARSLGESSYRGGQIFQWLYAKGATDFAEMTDLGKVVREQLEAHSVIERLELVTRQESSLDGTTKFAFRMPRGGTIETVLIPPSSAFIGKEASGEDEQQRLTLCVSTQVGCPLDCAFCATGTMGFGRNLTTGEIVSQVLEVRRLALRKITNVVFMGMGEPMLNYASVMRAADILTEGMGIAARRVTISTAGWVDGIRRMGDDRRKQKLAISLHSAVEETRTLLMPVNRRHPLAALRDAAAYYYARTGMRVTYEFILFDGVNDTDAEIGRLITFARQVPSKINVIPFHSISSAGPGAFGETLRASRYQEEIVERLRRANLTVMIRSSAGEDIDAACGQLATHAVAGRSVHRRKTASRQEHT